MRRAAPARRLLDALREFVSIETGSRDIEGLARATELLAAKLRALGGTVEFIARVVMDAARGKGL